MYDRETKPLVAQRINARRRRRKIRFSRRPESRDPKVFDEIITFLSKVECASMGGGCMKIDPNLSQISLEWTLENYL